MNDSLSDFFTRIRNASFLGHDQVIVPLTKINKSCAQILFQQGFIVSYQHQKPQASKGLPDKIVQARPVRKNNDQASGDLVVKLKYKNQRPMITQLRRLSRPGCRFYVHSGQISQILHGSSSQRRTPGAPMILLSTSHGLLSDREARHLNIGGEVLGIVS